MLAKNEKFADICIQELEFRYLVTDVFCTIRTKSQQVLADSYQMHLDVFSEQIYLEREALAEELAARYQELGVFRCLL